MTTQIKRRRGTTTQHSSFTGAEGELTIDTTKDTVVVHDGTTSGGHPLAKESSLTGKVDKAGDTMTGPLDVQSTITSEGLTVDQTSGYVLLQDLNAAVVSGTDMGGVKWRTGDSTVSGSNRITAAIRAEGDGTFNAVDKAPTKLVFSTHGNSGVDPVDRMTINSDGDISFYEDTGTTPKFFWDASAERLSIGTVGPNSLLYLYGAPEATSGAVATIRDSNATGSNTSFGSLVFSSSPGTDYAIGKSNVNAASTLSFRNANTGTSYVDIDSSGNVGIGTSSPDYQVQIENSGEANLSIKSGVSNYAQILLGDGGNATLGRLRYNNADNSFQTVVNGGVATTITSSGNVGIGTSSPSALLTVGNGLTGTKTIALNGGGSSSSVMNLDFLGGGTGNPSGRIGYASSTEAMTFHTGDLASIAERMRITSSGNVGIGTSSPTAIAANYTTLHLDGSSGSGIHLTKTTSGTTATDGSHLFNAGGDFYLYHYESGNIVFSSGASATERMRIDSSGNVGIGTSSPSGKLHVESNDASQLSLTRTGVGTYGIGVVSGDALIFQDGSTERMRIDSSGNVGIGTSSPDQILHVEKSVAGGGVELLVGNSGANQSGTYSQIGLGTGGDSTGTAYFRLYRDGSGVSELGGYTTQTFHTNSAERMRIDSSGNLLVGKTATNYLTNGVEAKTDGSLWTTATNNGPLVATRKSSDGNIASFYKDSSFVGSIGSASGATTYIDGGSQFAGLQFGGDGVSEGRITPRRNGASADGQTDLGTSSLRFKDLYLSGSIHGDVKFENNAGTTEYARFNSSGDLLVGKTSIGLSTTGIDLRSTGLLQAIRDGGTVVELNRQTSDGTIIDLRKDNTTVGSIGTDATVTYMMYYSSTGLRGGSAGIVPATTNGAISDNTKDWGAASVRWDDIYATNGTIQTSDRNEKQDIEALSDAEQRVAVAAKGLLRKFRWIDAVEEKGDEARTHFGIIAQDLQAAFAAEGLDAGDYAMFTSSTWTDEETGEERTRMGVRYSELLAFIIAAI